jgi:hypothetical protein
MNRHPCICLSPLILSLVGLCLAGYCPAIAASDNQTDQFARQVSAAQIPLEKIAEPLRSKVALVLKKSQIFERGKSEAFPCNPEVYRWLLESPDASLFGWRKLGATKASILRQPDGSFLGTDGMGGELRWNLIATGPQSRVWYAEGSGRMGPLLPTMTVRAIVLLTFQEVHGTDARVGVKHRLDLFAHYDSTPLITKLTGISADTAGKKALQQIELFFSGMAWYASEHSTWAKTTFSQWANDSEAKTRIQPLMDLLSQGPAKAPTPGAPSKEQTTSK